MSPETSRSLDAFVLIRRQVREALEVAHAVGLDPNPLVKAEYYRIANLLIAMDERGKAEWGEANYSARVEAAH